MKGFPEFSGFEWDEANREKSPRRHRVSWWECEEIFSNQPLYIVPDQEHSATENRFYALGRTHNDRLLFVVFTQRKSRVRIISARDMSKKERKVYLEKARKDSKV